MAQTYDTFWQQRYARHLREQRAAQVEVIASGNVADLAEYKSMVGVVRGIDLALEAIEEVNAEIRKAEQGGK